MAPEVRLETWPNGLHGESFDGPPTDIFSLGVTFYSVYTGTNPLLSDVCGTGVDSGKNNSGKFDFLKMTDEEREKYIKGNIRCIPFSSCVSAMLRGRQCDRICAKGVVDSLEYPSCSIVKKVT